MPDYSLFVKKNIFRLRLTKLFLPHPNTSFKNTEWKDNQFKVLIVRLTLFHDIAQSTPHLFLANAVRKTIPNVYIDMAFLPVYKDRILMLENKIPLLIGVESYCSIEDFDLVLVSNSYTLELLNFYYLLLGSNIPLWSSQRHEKYPPIILGGSNSLVTQSIINEEKDCIADGIFFGDGEIELEKMLNLFVDLKKINKKERLSKIADKVGALWVAGEKNKKIKKNTYQILSKEQIVTWYPIMGDEEAKTAKIQISYGCPFSCSFCFEGCTRKPYRELPLEQLKEAGLLLKINSGADTLEISSFNFNTYPDIFALILFFNHIFYKVNYMSQRVDILNNTPVLLDFEIAGDKRSFTLGVEGISERLRGFLNKQVSLEEIKQILAKLLQRKIREIKIFYVITGYETEKDFDEFAIFVKWLKLERTKTNPGLRIIFSFNYLIRMPFTPLSYAKLFLEEKDILQKKGLLKSVCETNGFEFRISSEWQDYAVTQVMTLGGYDLSTPMIEIAKKALIYEENINYEAWKILSHWLRTNKHYIDFLSEKESDYSFPMEFIDSPVNRVNLFKEYQNLLSFMNEKKKTLKRKKLFKGLKPEKDSVKILEHLVKKKQALKPIYCEIYIPPSVIGASSKWLAAWSMQRILQKYPVLADKILDVKEVFFADWITKKIYTPLFGRTIFQIKTWDEVKVREVFSLHDNLSNQNDIYLDRVFLKYDRSLVQNIHLDIIFSEIIPEMPLTLITNFCKEFYCPVTVKRIKNGFSLEVAEKFKKKKILLNGYTTDNQLKASLTVGLKFALEDFIELLNKNIESYRIEIKKISFG